MRRPVVLLGLAGALMASVFASCGSTTETLPEDRSISIAGAPDEEPPTKAPAPPFGKQRDAGSDAADDSGEPPPSGAGDSDGGALDAGEDGGSRPAYDPEDGVLHVWTLGDSITVGVNGGYRNDIYKLLIADGFEVDMVGTLHDGSTEIADKDHEGHVAYTIANAMADVDGWLAKITPPDVVLLWLGCNDFAWWTNLLPAEHADQFDDLVDHLMDILPATAMLVIGTIPPESSKIIESVRLDRNDMADEFNELLRERVPLYPLYGERVFLADIRAEIELDDLYDGIHPTREAHARIAGIFHDVLRTNLGL